MLSDSRNVNKDFETIGPARLAVDVDGVLIEVARLNSASLVMDETQLDQKEIHEGSEVTIRQFQRSENHKLTLNFADRLSPDLWEALLGIEPTEVPATTESVSEYLRFDGLNPRKVLRPYGIAAAYSPPTGVAGTPFGTGGTITPGDYYVFVEAVYKGGGRSTAAFTVAAVTIAAGEKLAVEWSHPQREGQDIVPEYYKIYQSADEEADVADLLWKTVDGSVQSTVIAADPGSTVWPGAPGGIVILTEVGGAVMVLNTDYTFDSSTGLIQSLGTEAEPKLTPNKLYQLDYAINCPVQQYFDIGKLEVEPTYRRLVIEQITSLGDEEKGMRWELEKVNTKGDGITEAMSTNDFSDGVDVTMTCLYDLVTQRVGRKFIGGKIVTDWNSAI